MPSFPPSNYEDLAYEGTVTRRKQLRQVVRNTLGPGSDPAPTVRGTLAAADSLKALLDLASGGRYGLAVTDFSKQADDPERFIPISDAIAEVRERVYPELQA